MKTGHYRLPNGANLSYAEYGTPGGRAVVLLHGLIGSVASEGMEELFRDSSLRVIALARPGYGESDYFNMVHAADWGKLLERFFELHGLKKFAVLGISAGAPYAYSLAALYPERTERVYINSGVPAVYMPEILKLYPAADAAAYADFEKMSRGDAGRKLYESYLPALTENIREGRDFRDSMGGDLRNIGQEAKLQGRFWGFELSEIGCPVELIHGTEDGEVPYAAAAEMEKRLPNASLVPLKGKGHVPGEAEEYLMRKLEGTE